MAAFVTVYAGQSAPDPLEPWAWASLGAGLLLLGGIALWRLWGRPWGVSQFVAGVVAGIGTVLLCSLLWPQSKGNAFEGIVTGYEQRGGGSSFVVRGERLYASSRLSLRDGQRVRGTRVGATLVHIAVERASAMTEAEVAARERDARLSDESLGRVVVWVMSLIAVALFGWIAFGARHFRNRLSPMASVCFRVLAGFVALGVLTQFFAGRE